MDWSQAIIAIVTFFTGGGIVSILTSNIKKHQAQVSLQQQEQSLKKETIEAEVTSIQILNEQLDKMTRDMAELRKQVVDMNEEIMQKSLQINECQIKIAKLESQLQSYGAANVIENNETIKAN